ncbi:Nudix hydrolase [Naviculisporaceae sp. PSN 640]
MATTFTHPKYEIPITLPEGLSEKQVLEFHPFTSWLSTLQASLALQRSNPSHPFHSDPYILRGITIQSYDLFGPRVGFLKLTSNITTSSSSSPEGGKKAEHLPGAVFLRGPSVAMLVILIPDDNLTDGDGSQSEYVEGKKKKKGNEPAKDKEEEERYVLLTVQPRIAAGSLEFVELPAGMVDEAGNFSGTAAREIQEELGLEIPASELVCLSDLAFGVSSTSSRQSSGTTSTTEKEEEICKDGNLPRGVYPSPGACDEYIPIFMHERRVPRDQLGEWTGRLTGLREEGEKITLKLVKMGDLWKEAGRDAKALSAIALWEGLRREGKI